MSTTAINRYTLAIYHLSQESKRVEAVREDFKKVLKLSAESPELEAFLKNPTIPNKKRQGIINHIFKVGFDVLTHQFILFLSEKNRLNILKDICDVFEQTYLDSHNILKITITSSIALNDRQTVDIAEQLRRKFGKEIEMSATVDPSLIGGIKIRQGNTIFDYSFNAQLERFRANLIKA
jgi:F-type H+-transporting ATPase subunit delta